ncbi:cyclic nucleotide-binding domain-containing protein [Toxoplasma gondii ARI]|uniref:Cyclic nucleotide-binding domain-containing protein n=1 Tax=Toxoplasma gondii ARI TaxID=1074872 RepID=A0A139Y000_TOXGO|nr:cyclic nucleotide-binding domain-containing protein [Toxoplasma gondii ARI]
MPPEGGRRSREPRPSFSVSFASCPALEEPERGDTPGSPGSEERRQDGATEASDEGERQRAFRDTLQLFNTPPSERTATDVKPRSTSPVPPRKKTATMLCSCILRSTLLDVWYRRL